MVAVFWLLAALSLQAAAAPPAEAPGRDRDCAQLLRQEAVAQHRLKRVSQCPFAASRVFGFLRYQIGIFNAWVPTPSCMNL